MKLKRVALLTDGIWPYVIGGMQKHSYYLSKYLAKEKVEVVIFHPKIEGYTLQKQKEIFKKEELSFIEWIEVPNPPRHHFPGHYLFESYVYSKNVYSILNQQINRYDLIYIQGFSGWYTLLHHIHTNCPPMILNFHGLEMFQRAASLKNRFELLIFRVFVKHLLQKANYVQSLGSGLTRLLLRIGINKQKIVEIGIGIEKSWLSLEEVSFSKKKRVFTFIGRDERRKGILELNAVLEKVAPLYDFEFHFVGPIPAKQQLKSPKIYYHGLVRDEDAIKRILADTDFLVLPSYAEGMPTVILEAMSQNCAIIATDVGAVGEQVSDRNGLLIEPTSIDALYNAIEKAIEIQDLPLQKMKEHSSKMIRDRFIWDVQIKKMINEFLNIVETKKER